MHAGDCVNPMQFHSIFIESFHFSFFSAHSSLFASYQHRYYRLLVDQRVQCSIYSPLISNDNNVNDEMENCVFVLEFSSTAIHRGQLLFHFVLEIE